MSTINPTAAEIMEHREALMGIEVLMNHLTNQDIYEREPIETEIIFQALANDTNTRVRKALAWLEELHDDAEKAEAALKAD